MTNHEEKIFVLGFYPGGNEQVIKEFSLSNENVVHARKWLLHQARHDDQLIDFSIKRTCTSCWGTGVRLLADNSQQTPCGWCGGDKMEHMAV
jgi:hypothetical protein